MVGATGPSASAAASPYFRHGVASGDPLPDRVLLWTRLTPAPRLVPGVGSGPTVSGRWQVASDPTFVSLRASGGFTTSATADYTVKVDARGLSPDAPYYYRFLYNGAASPVGRTRTAPAVTASPSNLRFGVVSCSNLQAGYFSSYRHLASRDDLHAVLHLGDYVYEYGPGEYGYGHDNRDIRPHVPAREMVSLRDYRQRHGQYKQDVDLQRLHAKVPFIVTWDDHESSNDAYRDGAENHTPASEGNWQRRKASAHRAYDEWMPTRMSGTAATGDGDRLYRSLRFGTLANLSLLDLRSYRSQQVGQTALDDVDDPTRTITGDPQMTWLKNQLLTPVQWKVVGNPVMITPVVFPPLPSSLTDAVNDVTGLLPPDGVPYNVDQWDGYTADRSELFNHLADNGVRNAVFLTGDIHSGWACDLPVDVGTYPLSTTVGTEFVCTSITSNNLDDITGSPPRTSSIAVEEGFKSVNRHVKYLNFDDHGYSVVDITAARMQMDYYTISDRADPHGTSSWSQSWATNADTQRVHRVVGGPVR